VTFYWMSYVKGLVPVAMLLIGRGRPREHPNGHFRLKGPTRADIAQLSVAHARTKGDHVNFGDYVTLGHSR
jgi:hypothetical protein